MKLPKDYPIKTNEKELKELINQQMEEVVSSIGGGLMVNEESIHLLRIGKLQLGISELQSRQSKRVLKFTVLTAIFSLIISCTALLISINGNKKAGIQESEKINLQKEMLMEMRNINKNILLQIQITDSIEKN